MSDVIGTQMMDGCHLLFSRLIVINSLTTLATLAFVPLPPRDVMARREGEVRS